ncbi:cytochrome P450 [Crepidotus variabilis]|uniref:Cytochrome P450 n=1 Tax=Crepidotus variabilis TaxID=179855 RepID=A0A9P6JQK8_9AGAR|nr:cytochrome P450 [Crepidotus variabilis]
MFVTSSLLEILGANPRAVWSLIIGLVIYSFVRYIRSPLRHLPPGPPGVPIWGNKALLGKTQFKLFSRLSETYGPIIHLNNAGKHIVVLNSVKVTTDILERRAGIYSDRPNNIVGAEMMCGGNSLVFQHTGDRWRRMRKAAHEALRKDVIKQYQHAQWKESILLTSSLLKSGPQEWQSQIKRAAASGLLGLVYDMEPIKSMEEPQVVHIDGFMRRITKSTRPGAHLVESWPWMRHIPTQFAAWKKRALDSFASDSAAFGALFDHARQKLLSGDHTSSFAATLIKDSERNKLSDLENSWLASTIYAAGSDTTSSIMSWWVLAMTAHPEFQKKAQEEIDRVVGRDRLPTLDDMTSLPYVQATIRETARWRPPAPIGVPHRSTEDDWYEGHFIPKNSTVIVNIWNLNRDTSIFGPDVDVYNPERFLNETSELAPSASESKDMGHFSFGFGRRICVARYMAENVMFVYAASMLWALNFEAGKDEKGQTTPPNIQDMIEEGLVIRPPNFNCVASPRFPETITMLEQVKEDLDLKKYIHL